MRRIVIALIAALCAVSCGIYSFSGTSIQPDVKTINIDYFEYRALKVNPTLSNDFTESLREKFRRMTKLDRVEEDGDLEISGYVSGYDVRTTGVTANDQAAQNRLTVTVTVTFINRKYPKDGFENKQFSAYADFDATVDLASVESTLCKEIIEKLCEDIFNASVAQW